MPIMINFLLSVELKTSGVAAAKPSGVSGTGMVTFSPPRVEAMIEPRANPPTGSKFVLAVVKNPNRGSLVVVGTSTDPDAGKGAGGGGAAGSSG